MKELSYFIFIFVGRRVFLGMPLLFAVPEICCAYIENGAISLKFDIQWFSYETFRIELYSLSVITILYLILKGPSGPVLIYQT